MNPFTEVNWQPGTAEKRKFAVSLMIGFPALGVFFSLMAWITHHPWKPFYLHLGVYGFAAGLILWLLPAIAKPFYLAWYFVGCCMGFVIGNVLLSAFYLVIITPIGFVMRKCGALSQKKGFDKSATTYWSDVKKTVDPKRYYHQF